MLFTLTIRTDWQGFHFEREWWLPHNLGWRSVQFKLGFVVILLGWKTRGKK